jgi:DNA-binding beta-propeller fold protein YncE
LTDGGYLPTKPIEAVDGSPFLVPNPLPDCAHPIACDVAPPPVAPKGPVLRTFMQKGTEPGELAYPRAIAAAKDGSAYYIVDKMGRLQKLDSELHVRALVRTPEIDRGKPTGLAVADNGDVWVSDTHYARVLVYGPDLTLKRSWGVPGSKPGTFLFLRDVKPLGDGRILTADYGDDVARVQIFDAESPDKLSLGFGHFGTRPGEFQRPMKVAPDLAHGELWVADSVNHRIQVLSLDGKPLRVFGGLGDEQGKLKYPYDVVLDEEGRAWVAEFGNHRIQVFDRDGRSLAVWGKAGRGEGEIAFPWGLAIEPKGRLLVIDSGNDRIYELDRSAILKSGAAAPGKG